MSAVRKDIQLHIRRMQEDDLAVVFENEIAAYTHPWTEGILHDCLKSSYQCWLCEVEGLVIGHCVMSVAVGEAHILNICIHPDQQGKGLGRTLLKRMSRVAQESNADTMFLEVRVSNLTAMKLYESEGFCEIGQRRGYYPADNNQREDAVIYAKPLMK